MKCLFKSHGRYKNNRWTNINPLPQWNHIWQTPGKNWTGHQKTRWSLNTLHHIHKLLQNCWRKSTPIVHSMPKLRIHFRLVLIIYWFISLHTCCCLARILRCRSTFASQLSGADPGFCVRVDESRRGVWGPIKVTCGSRAKPPRKFLGFENIGSFSVNNFEAVCECDEVSASLHETIDLFKKWTIVRPSCFAPKERSALKKKSSPIYLGPKKIIRPRYVSAQKISFAIELTV
jgi:hypothetical protein